MKRALPLFALVASAAAEEPSLALARKLTNPFADVINVPINQNPDFGLGEGDDDFRYTLTVQPVIPFAINRDWNIISRTVLPVIYQENGQQSDSGFGDTAQSFFLSPTNAEDNGWCWGVGPIFILPTATEDRFGTDQLSIGPTVGLLKRDGPWTIGALTNHTWSLHGDDEKRSEVNATFLQPFIDYTTESKTTFSINTESTYDWARGQWTVPINCVVRQLFDLGSTKMSVAFGPRFYLEGPSGAPEWGLRLGITLIFPN
ncbi:MAG: transporter [Luteolibacter sp.]